MEKYAPLARMSSVRFLFAHAVQYRLSIHKMDVKNAFLNAYLQETAYMHQTEGYIDAQRPDDICKLNRTIYGFKLSAKEWYVRIKTVLQSLSLEPTRAYPTIVFRFVHMKEVWMAAYVENLIILAVNEQALNTVKEALSSLFKKKDMYEVSEFLRIEVKYNRKENVLPLSQKNAVLKILEKYNMENCKNVSTPIEKNYASSLRQIQSEPCKGQYREAIGSLLYLALSTRPDISFAVGVMSKFCETPSVVH